MTASESRKLAREVLAGKWGKVALVTLVYFLITTGIKFVCNLIPAVGSIAELVVSIPITFGLVVTFMKIKKGEETTYTEFLNNGFNNFAQSWKVTLWAFVKMIVPVILMVVSIVVIVVGFVIFAANAAQGFSFEGPIDQSLEELAEYINAHSNVQTNPVGSFIALIGFVGLVISSLWLTIRNYLYKIVYFILADNPDKDAKAVVEESASIMKGNRWKYFCLELSFIGWIILASMSFGIGMLWLMPYMLIAEICFYENLAKKDVEVEVKQEEEN